MLKFLSLKLLLESEFPSLRIFLVKVTLKNGQEKYLLSILFWKQILRVINLAI